jgi:hypothetical protein
LPGALHSLAPGILERLKLLRTASHGDVQDFQSLKCIICPETSWSASAVKRSQAQIASAGVNFARRRHVLASYSSCSNCQRANSPRGRR